MKYYITNKGEILQEYKNPKKIDGKIEMNLVKAYPAITYQEVLGMGGAFTEAAAYTYENMSSEKQKELLELYFGPKGNNYNFCRTHIQSCDFSLGNYMYIEDETDKDLATFNLERDHKYLIPFIKAAMKENSSINFLASPWSPPPFMKTNGEMNHGGKLKEEYYDMWADMIAKYVEEYRAMGIPISRLTVQNEPAATQTWDSCVYTATEEATFVVKYLRAALQKRKIDDIKISIWDHNKELMLDRATESFAVEGAKQAIDGIAFHWYSGDHFEALAETRNQYPDKELIFTEGCVEYSRFVGDRRVQNAEMYAHDIIGNFKAGMNAFIDWNLILDEKGGPNHVGNYCDSPVMCDTKKDSIDIKLSYYYIGHFSRFIQPGARRILVSSFHKDVETVGFKNPDGQLVIIALNNSEEDKEIVLTDQRESYEITLKSHSIITACF